MTGGADGRALAAALRGPVLERFDRYARVDTQAAYLSDTYPSRLEQLDLCRLLVAELLELGVVDAAMDELGRVFATVPGTAAAPVLGLVAHVDTSPDAPSAGVSPVVHPQWDGSTIVLPVGDQRLDATTSADLADCVGHDIVTTDGSTLLGADPKAGIAAIMTALAHLLANPELPRPTIRIAFTLDEEVGGGTRDFDVARFGAAAAYTVDGSTGATLDVETFSADEVVVTVHGVNVHPGFAKDTMVNAVRLTARIVASLPSDRLSPETTSGREGFVHPYAVEGNEERVVLPFLTRDHDDARLREHNELVERVAAEVATTEPRARIEVEVSTTYRNMRTALKQHPWVVDAAEEAMRRAGLSPRRTLIRGGTDGAWLMEMGLPTPNIFTGGREFHSTREWLSVDDMADSAATLVHLAAVWATLDRVSETTAAALVAQAQGAAAPRR